MHTNKDNPAQPGPSRQQSTRSEVLEAANLEVKKLSYSLKSFDGSNSLEEVKILIALSEACGKCGDEKHYQEQRKLAEEALRIIGKYSDRWNYGISHKETVTVFYRVKALHKLGNAYFNLREVEKAKEKYERALELNESLKHPDRVKKIEIAELCNNLGSVYHALQDYPKAKEMFDIALPILKEVEGAENIKVGMLYNNLAKVYRGLGNQFAAAESFKKALPIYKEFYGDQSIEVGRISNGLGSTYFDLAQTGESRDQKGDIRQACQHHENAVTIYQKFYGDTHIEVAEVLDNLANDYDSLAEKLYQERSGAYQKFETKADELREEELRVCQKSLNQKFLEMEIKNSPRDVEAAAELGNLGNRFHNLKDFKSAIRSYEEELKIKEKLYDIKREDNNVKTGAGSAQIDGDIKKVETLKNLGMSYYYFWNSEKRIENLENAIESHRAALAIQKKHFGPQDPVAEQISGDLKTVMLNNLEASCGNIKSPFELGRVFRKLADTYGELQDYKKQEFYLRQALPIIKETLGDSNTTVLQILNALADVCDTLKKSAEARQLRQEASVVKASLNTKFQTAERKQKAVYFSPDLSYYVRKGDFEGVKHLVEKGADVNQQDAYGITPLHVAAEGTSVDHTKIINYLLSKGANPNKQNGEGKTPVHISARYGRPQSLKSFLEHEGINQNIRDEKGYSPLDIAIKVNQHERAVILLRNGAESHVLFDPEYAKEKQNLYSDAEKKGYNDIMYMLSSAPSSFKYSPSVEPLARQIEKS